MGTTFELPSEYIAIVNADRATLAQTLGWTLIRQVVYDVLCGENIRNLTEKLTPRRLAMLNAAFLVWLLDQKDPDKLFEQAAKTLQGQNLAKAERWTAQWVLGLTDKARQNILRDKSVAVDEYVREYRNTIREVAQESLNTFGELQGNLQIGSHGQSVEWQFFLELLSAIGAQTLTVRGSEKSLYGKFFEPLVLGTLLHCLGFQMIPGPQKVPHNPQKVFWLSSQTQKRESDATLIYRPGKGVRFDIGFIGRGNPEISLDKVSRFERQSEIHDHAYDILTIILVDRIGENSRIREQARLIHGYIVQMSMSFWPRNVAQILQQEVGFTHPLLTLDTPDLSEYLRKCVALAPLETFLFYGRHEANSNE
ncbi:MAG TPA: CfrBI family restriction endonuclease [Anaerolineae bacterium]|nr:CfrBI family restriction endonuclease [Anaerolineae bacterium]HQK14054.1 CfrBI family restriction endonuclease [Anaerolineae bacterium]